MVPHCGNGPHSSPFTPPHNVPTQARWHHRRAGHQTGASGLRFASGGRLQQTCSIPPDLNRSLPAGQAVIVRQGHWGHVAVAPPG